jgi:outer membrane protein assembly factor BamB
MTETPLGEPTPRAPLRLWPGVVLVVLQWLTFFLLPIAFPAAQLYAVLVGLACGPLVLVWWLFFSRASWPERLVALAVTIVGLITTPYVLHESVAKGNVGFQFYIWVIPILSLAFIAWAVAGRRLADGPRRVAMVATILLACGSLALVRNDGLRGDGTPEFSWRWSATAEERLVAAAADESMARLAVPAKPAQADWPGFRGPDRSGVLPGVRLATDWSQTPPVELWRRPVGPGTSSFAVGGGLLYTQEQRGEDEIVAAYELRTGTPVWIHREATRYSDPYVGAGPRATPALADGRVYALGATGILNALDARDGTVVWSRHPAPDAGVPLWGFVGSPLVVDDLVIVYTESLVAYDGATGAPRWTVTDIGGSYGSPQLSTLHGAAQILLQRNAGATGFALADGARLWEHPWPGIGILQPVLTADGDLLVSTINDAAMPQGVRRIAVTRESGGWSVRERWATERLRPSFSSMVVHDGHVFGFDSRILTCIDVEDGRREWKGGRYGDGQLLLLPDQDLLLVVSEQGELALVAATADRFTELARFAAIAGKTWNQPALVDDVLLVRNGQEMAAFRLALAGG